MALKMETAAQLGYKKLFRLAHKTTITTITLQVVSEIILNGILMGPVKAIKDRFIRW